MEDNASFCPSCGNPIQPRDSNPGKSEVIVRDVSKQTEQRTINHHQAFGWKLLTNQEINITETYGSGNASNVNVWSQTKTHVKLTFERNTGMRNYEILNEKYKSYCALEEEYNQTEHEIAKASFSVPAWLVSGVLLTVIFSVFSINLLYDPDLFLIIMMIIPGLLIGGGIGAIFGFIGGAIRKSSRKKKYAPRLAELDRQMNQLAAEASAYLD